MRRQKKEFTPKFVILLIVFLFIGGGFYTTSFFKKEVLNQQNEKLTTEINLLTPYLFEQNKLVIDEEKLDKSVPDSERLTVLDKHGAIQYDSTHGTLAKGTREKRPEIKEILEEGKSEGYAIRDSQTVGEKMIYVAKGIYQDGELVGILRLSEKYTGITSSLKQFQRSVFLILLVIAVIILSMYVYIWRQSQKPIQFILPILRQAIRNPEKKQIVVDAPSEWQELYQTVYELMDEASLLYYKQLQNEKKLSFLFENLDIGIFILDENLDLVLANQVTEQLFSKKKEKMNYKNWFNHQKMNQLIKEAVSQQTQVQRDIRITTPKNHDLNVVIRLLEADTTEYVGIIYDVTEMKQIEQVHEDFISNISHELKTPTTSIIGFAETLLAGAKDDPEASEQFLQIIETEGKRLLVLIQNIMTLLKTEKDIYLLDAVVSDPVTVISEELERYQFKIKEKQINVSFDSATHTSINLPGNAFQLIVKNLIENAVEYTREKDSIFIYLKEQDGELILTVEDTGIGISEVDQKRIFERFYRVSESRQRNTGGSGLGLSIVQHYTEILGGTVKLTSDVNEGTTVIVRVPLT
ncbi:ATP-binding protein [Vagococcus carniphilus]|uniref:ATP-binding protein n=1 Tax=Vagococcus carniphilus TaxID=218144 RepID=UPI00288D103D|nr:ATP-binding protein [Vagococcus carniphilus]MDT2831000.1 ATP-binding protein [Vagococcus carniphilus]MDT2838103.1 ATP-binding protein [Vagococcus carniphilus]MDT2853736.1 ATP-binding protein [Vagococcus carniphilus]